VLMSVINLSNTVGDNVGSYLYADAFARNLPPLIIISAAFTAFAFILVPLLHLGDKPQGAPAVPGDHLGSKMEPDATSAR
jgi:hypothetical protein